MNKNRFTPLSTAAPHTRSVKLDVSPIAVEPDLRRFLVGDETPASLVIMYAILTSGAVLDALERTEAGESEVSDEVPSRAASLSAQIEAVVNASPWNRTVLWYGFLTLAAKLVRWGRRSTPHRDLATWAGASAEAAPTLALRRQTIDMLLAWIDGETAGSSCVLEPTTETFGAMIALSTTAMVVLEDGYTGTWGHTLAAAFGGLESDWAGGDDTARLDDMPRPAWSRLAPGPEPTTWTLRRARRSLATPGVVGG